MPFFDLSRDLDLDEEEEEDEVLLEAEAFPVGSDFDLLRAGEEAGGEADMGGEFGNTAGDAGVNEGRVAAGGTVTVADDIDQQAGQQPQ